MSSLLEYYIGIIEERNKKLGEGQKVSTDSLKSINFDNEESITNAINQLEAINNNPNFSNINLQSLIDSLSKSLESKKDNEVVSSINSAVSAIEAMNTFVDDSNKLSTTAIKTALQTKGVSDISLALEEANKIKASGNAYADTIIEGLNKLNEKYISNLQRAEEIEEERKAIEEQREREKLTIDDNIISSINTNISAIEAMNTFVDDSNKLSTAAIKKALETKNINDLGAAISEAEKIKTSGNTYGESIYNTLIDIQNNYDEMNKTENPTIEEDSVNRLEEIDKEEQQLEKDQEQLINSITDNLTAVEAMNIFADEGSRLPTITIRNALETKDTNDLENALVEANYIKESGNSYADAIIDSLNKVSENQTKIAELVENKNEIEAKLQEIESAKQKELVEQGEQEKVEQEQKAQEQQNIVNLINSDIAAIETMNTFVDDNNKLSTAAIKKALATKEDADIEAAINEANELIAQGNPYGNSILENLNKLEKTESVVTEEQKPVDEVKEETPEVKDENQDKLQDIEDQFYNSLISADQYEAEKKTILNPIEEKEEEKTQPTDEQEEPKKEEPELSVEAKEEVNELKKEVDEAAKEGLDLDKFREDIIKAKSQDIYTKLFELKRGNLYNGTNPIYQEQLSAIREKEAEYAKILSEKDTIDFENAKAVSAWLDKLTPYINTHALTLNPGSNVSLESADKYLLSIFAEKGYTPNMESDNSLVETIGKKLNELAQKHYIESEYPNLPEEFLRLNSEKSMALATKNYLVEQAGFNKVAIMKMMMKKDQKEMDENGKPTDKYVLSEEQRKIYEDKIEEFKPKVEAMIRLADTLTGEYRLSETIIGNETEKQDTAPTPEEPKAEETNEEAKDEEFDYTVNDNHKLNNFMPIKAFGKIKKSLYDKITAISFKKSLKSAVEKLRELRKSAILSSKLKFEKAKDAVVAEVEKINIKRENNKADVDIDLSKEDENIARANSVLDSILKEAKVEEAPTEEKETPNEEKPDVIVDTSANGEWDQLSENKTQEAPAESQEEVTEENSEDKGKWDEVDGVEGPKQEEPAPAPSETTTEYDQIPELNAQSNVEEPVEQNDELPKNSWDNINEEQPVVGKGI